MEIRPSEALWSSVVDALPGWRSIEDRQVSKMLAILPGPVQDSMMGISLAGLGDVDPAAVLPDCYSKRRDLESLIKDLDRRYYEDPIIVQARPSYAPLRLLGWWNRCLSDEIDWLNGDGVVMADPYGKTRPWAPPVKAPPRFWRWEISDWDGVRGVCRQIAVMQGSSEHSVDVMMDVLESSVDLGDADGVMDALVDLMKARPFVSRVSGIDVETTGLDPLRCWMINAGWLMTDLDDPDGETWGEASRSYGLPKTRSLLGNPTDYISGIKAVDLIGLPRIDEDLMAQQDVLDVVTAHPYVAHSSRTEDSFFRQNITGYAEAKRDGMVKIIDSRAVSQRLDDYPGKISNRLEDYAKRWGVIPEDGRERHLGLDDSKIMLTALGRNLRSIHGGPDSRHYRDALLEDRVGEGDERHGLGVI